MAAPAAMLALLPLLAKIPGALKALYASKHFWPGAVGGAFLGSTALGEMGKAGERGLSREQIALQKLMSEAQVGAAKKVTEASQKRTEKYMDELMKARKEEKKEAREAVLMQTFSQSQDRQMALVMQAVQAMSQRPSVAGSSSGMLGVMRGNF